MKKKNYKLLLRVKQAVFVLALALLSCSAFAQVTFTLNYTGNVQSVTLLPGTYDIKMWGADGGNSGNSRAGIGGYSNGTLTLASTTTVYVVVGGAGLYTGSSGLQPGGYNGGGSGYASSTGRAGGGATHIATLTGVLSALSNNTAAVIMVAGGGGGDQNAGTIGHGGGLTGGGTYPGTQTGSAGGIFGSFGQGGNITTSYGGGGGGGWYGGGGYQNNAGSGGSGYIGGVTNGITTMSNTSGFVTKPTSGGDGLVIITELCSMSLYAAGPTNSLFPAICSGQTATLMTNAIGNYLWSTGSTQSSLVISPTTNTVYTLTGTGPSNCTASRNISVTVSGSAPVLSITNPSNNICLGRTISLSASGALSYTWANPGVVNGQTFTPTSTAVYTVSGENGCGITTATTAVTVSPLSVAASASPTLVCHGSATTLTAISSVGNFTWFPGSLPGGSVVVVPPANAIYTVASSDGTCSGTQTVAVNTKVTPTLQVSSTASMICAGAQVIISVTGANSYTWMPGNLSGNSVTVSPASSTLYVVTGENANNCFDNESQVVIVNSSPTLNVSASDLIVCAGQSVQLSVNGGNTYTWTGGPNTDTYVVTPAATTVYSVTGSQSSNTCTAVKEITITAIVPNLTLPSNTAVCVGGTATLQASGADLYSWNSIPTGSNGIYNMSPQSTTTVTLVATTESLSVSCHHTHTFVITVNPLPTLSVTAAKTTICKGETNTLTVSGAQSYSWTSTTTGSMIVITPTANVTYTVAGMDANGCVNVGSHQAKINSCNGISEVVPQSGLRIFPNPNNGSFNVTSVSGAQLILSNQLGQQLRPIELNEANGFSVELKDLTPGIYFITDIRHATPAFKVIVN